MRPEHSVREECWMIPKGYFWVVKGMKMLNGVKEWNRINTS